MTHFDISHNLLTFLPPKLLRSWETPEEGATLPQPAAARQPSLPWNEPRVHLLEQQQHLRPDRSLAQQHAETDDAEALLQSHRKGHPEVIRRQGEQHSLPLLGPLPHPGL
ncbi:hypothetical protein CEXT_722641 [Caerostris extrusa]|uniref:Uncharacterized protein n=1 Tax=Caerostris extrusa TaxID=172846 RepID=A0AAV4VGF6_CAEEX|nr:hypothetical protein CEXT_722641 [Caerostris extrusa]